MGVMKEQDAGNLLREIKSLGIPLWIGGGWGVDALIGAQTRPHNDIDVYIEKRHADDVINMLISRGYSERTMEYTTENHRVWQRAPGHTVDLHLIELREEEKDVLYFEGEAYPRFVLEGEGTIDGVGVQCFTAEAQLLFHQGYEHTEKDVHDVLLLCKTFGLDIPEEYQ